MITKLLAVLLFAFADSAIELPRIGCWQEQGQRQQADESPKARALYGVPGNLIARDEEQCENPAVFSEADSEGVRTLPLNVRWLLAEDARGERFLLYRRRAGSEPERYELPR